MFGSTGHADFYVQRILTSTRKAAGKLRRHTSPKEATRHFVRLLTIAAKTCFWLVAYHYYGGRELLYMAAAWMFALGVKDLLFSRLRLSSVHRPERRPRAVVLSFGLEVVSLLVRLLLMVGLVWLISPFSQTTASLLAGLMLCHIFWSRETISNLTSVYKMAPARLYIGCASALGGIGALFYCAETGRIAVEAALAGLVLREAIWFAGLAAAALAGRLGLRLGDGDEVDDEDGDAARSVVGHEGREVRSTWKLLIADNAVWSRWRLIQFGTRYIASGILGPFGGAAARILFTYKQPGAYVHRNERLKLWQIIAAFFGTLAPLAAAILIAERWGLLHALGLTLAGFVFRLTAIIANMLLWRQLTPLVGLEGKIPFPPAKLFGKKT